MSLSLSVLEGVVARLISGCAWPLLLCSLNGQRPTHVTVLLDLGSKSCYISTVVVLYIQLVGSPRANPSTFWVTTFKTASLLDQN